MYLVQKHEINSLAVRGYYSLAAAHKTLLLFKLVDISVDYSLVLEITVLPRHVSRVSKISCIVADHPHCTFIST
jgi:hypothetical protein